MKKSRLARLSVLIFLVICLSGCATISKQKDVESISLRNQISSLEAKIQEKDAEIDSLRKALSRVTEEKYTAIKGAHLKERTPLSPTNKQIQIALKNAGFDPGHIDGHIGKSTRKAIKEFQKANNLMVDGKVGKQTWRLLRQYL